MTEGNPTRLLLVFALPMLIGNLFQQMYNIVDSVIVGRFCGTNALAAIGATGAVNFFFFALCNGVGVGGGILTAKHFGAGEDEQVRSSIVNSGYTLITGSVLIGTVAYFSMEGLLTIMGTPEEILEDALKYVRLVSLALPLVGIYNHASSMLQALGDSRTPLYFLVAACILNIVLDIWFVYWLDMGVQGAAVATVISQFVSGIGSLTYAFLTNPYFKLKRQHFRPQPNIIRATLRLGVPLSLQNGMIALSCIALQRFINGFGPVAVAAFAATDRVEGLLHQPFGSVSTALSNYAGQNLGAGKIDRLREGHRKAMRIMLLVAVGLMLLMQLCGKWIIGVFVDDAEVIRCGATALRITSAFYIPLAILYICRALLTGVGDSLFALINGGVEIFTRVFLPMVFIAIPFIGIWGLWLSVGICWCAGCAASIFRYRWWMRKNENYKKPLSVKS